MFVAYRIRKSEWDRPENTQLHLFARRVHKTGTELQQQQQREKKWSEKDTRFIAIDTAYILMFIPIYPI